MAELPPQSNVELAASRWITGEAKAKCDDCDWRHDGRDVKWSTVSAAARRHVRETDHRVWLDRSRGAQHG